MCPRPERPLFTRLKPGIDVSVSPVEEESPPAFVYHDEPLQLEHTADIPPHHPGPTLTSRMDFPVSAAVKPAEAHTRGTSPFKPPSANNRSLPRPCSPVEVKNKESP